MIPTWISKELLDQCAAVFTIFGFPALLISLRYASRLDHRISEQLSSMHGIAQSQNEQLSELIRIAQSQNAIALNTMIFNDPINVGIMGAIETDAPILKEHKGKFLSVQLDKYLGDFETVAMVYDEGLLTKLQLEQHFSDYIERLSSNREVAEYLENNPEYFGGLRTLFKLLKRTDGELQASALGT